MIIVILDETLAFENLIALFGGGYYYLSDNVLLNFLVLSLVKCWALFLVVSLPVWLHSSPFQLD